MYSWCHVGRIMFFFFFDWPVGNVMFFPGPACPHLFNSAAWFVADWLLLNREPRLLQVSRAKCNGMSRSWNQHRFTQHILGGKCFLIVRLHEGAYYLVDSSEMLSEEPTKYLSDFYNNVFWVPQLTLSVFLLSCVCSWLRAFCSIFLWCFVCSCIATAIHYVVFLLSTFRDLVSVSK